MPGSKEKKSGILLGEYDENIVYFDSTFNNKKSNKNAEEIKKYVEEYNLQNSNINTIQHYDKYDELSKLKKLLDDNIITVEEFETEKKRLLEK